jgi:NAD(P)-dependent dehydrogenase (short-subunit alcohol dehydrogenase family)
MGKLDGKVALITGGTSGMGEAFAKLFAKEGAEVVVVGRSEEKGDKVVVNITNEGGKAQFMYCDVTSSESVNELKKNYMKQYNHLDILLNNAGVLITSPIGEIKEEDWECVFNTNTHSVMRMTQAFIDLVIKCHGNILNNTSIDGLQSNTRGRANLAYCASKSAAIKFTQQCALIYTPQGIRVNCLCPGVTETPFFTNRDFSRFVDAIPMGRVGQPDEIAKAALFLVSDDASYVSGAVLTVDGAASLK